MATNFHSTTLQRVESAVTECMVMLHDMSSSGASSSGRRAKRASANVSEVEGRGRAAGGRQGAAGLKGDSYGRRSLSPHTLAAHTRRQTPSPGVKQQGVVSGLKPVNEDGRRTLDPPPLMWTPQSTQHKAPASSASPDWADVRKTNLSDLKDKLRQFRADRAHPQTGGGGGGGEGKGGPGSGGPGGGREGTPHKQSSTPPMTKWYEDEEGVLTYKIETEAAAHKRGNGRDGNAWNSRLHGGNGVRLRGGVPEHGGDNPPPSPHTAALLRDMISFKARLFDGGAQGGKQEGGENDTRAPGGSGGAGRVKAGAAAQQHSRKETAGGFSLLDSQLVLLANSNGAGREYSVVRD